MAREMNEDDPRYIPDDLKETLEAERSMLNPDDTVEQQARKIFGENVAAAAATITQIAVHGTTERIRLDASKYVTERVLGRIGDDVGITDPLAEFLKGVEQFANAGANADDSGR